MEIRGFAFPVFSPRKLGFPSTVVESFGIIHPEILNNSRELLRGCQKWLHQIVFEAEIVQLQSYATDKERKKKLESSVFVEASLL